MKAKETSDIIQNWDLYAITDIGMTGNLSYTQIVRDLLEGGVRVIQLRDKTTSFDDLLPIGRQLVNLTREYNAQLIVNDNPYLAKEIDADGLHLGQSDCPLEVAREIIGANKILGLSTHNIPQALRAQMQEVDYLGLGPIFKTSSKQSEYPVLGEKIIKWAADNLRKPFVCIGGINESNIKTVAENGGRICAVISALMKQSDLRGAATNLRELMLNKKD